MPSHYRFTVAEYHQMIDAGVLTKDHRVELIDGEILNKMSIGVLHISLVIWLTQSLSKRLGDSAFISIQLPICLPTSEPEPDVSVLRPRPDYYAAGKPTAEDVLLLIEVADSSLAFDRSRKQKNYASAGIGEYWIINANDRSLEVYRQPQAETYAEKQTLREQQTITPLAFADVTLSVQDLFPPTAT